ncbi:Arylsulfatase [Planctomycetes bacterium Pan216]|uniref:Arylsulfatase n=1 Tax=Kolteria novifilia TaxID=2527975 RepID=A0A518B7L5_9BACT|nr:Arylsulfatase [Planctomycetes bacterium Pan216]
MSLPMIALVLGSFLGLAADGGKPERKPNVLLIFTDDQGSVDVNCYGAKDLITPNMDGLAEKGVRFTQFYAAAPVCSPSRAALLTGRCPQRAGLPHNAGRDHGGLPGEQVTLAEMFKKAGYATGLVGKWHLGHPEELQPNAQGFDSAFGHLGGCIDNYSHFFYWRGPNEHDLFRDGKEVFADGEFFGDLMVEEVDAFLEKNRDRPFFLYWAINMPHYPLQPTKKWRDRYTDLEMPRRDYAAFVSTTDEMIGQVLAKLDELGLREDTIVVFQSDHGHSTEERTFGGGGSAGPYRGAKFCLFEGGIRVPAMISWTGTLPEGEVRDQLGTGTDWMATLAELTGVALPERKLDSQSLVPVIKSAKAHSPHKVYHWQTGGRKKPQWAVREGDWKLIGNPRDTSNKGPLTKKDQLFLVNLADDVSEMTNVAAEHPEIVARLHGLHDTWIDEVSPPTVTAARP